MSAPVRHIVNAIVISHNGERWLGELTAGLRQQRRRVDRVLCVDTGSTDNSRDQLARAFGPETVTSVGPSTGFGRAVGQAVRTLPTPVPDAVEWLWLLHDDCAPTPGALHEMLLLLEEVPAAAVVGPKLRSWPRGRQLMELGVTITGSGARETGMEFAEFDQGQHDVVRETLAVSTAGMLVRRDVFEQLGGFDPRIKLFREDVDFGWRVHRAGFHVITCPDAIVFHAEAGARSARRLDAVHGARPRRADRTSAIYTLLVNCSWWALPFVGLRMILGSLLRTVGLLIAKWPDAAYDELRALLSTLARPDKVLGGRMRRTRGRKVSRRKFRHLFPPPWIGLQHGLDTVTSFLTTSTESAGSHTGSRKRPRTVETGPVAEEAEELETTGPGRVIWALTRPPVLLFFGLTLVALVAGRELLFGGALRGGALLPAPDSAWDLWRRYLESWHPVELGSSRAAPPYLVFVALLGTLFAGNVSLAVSVLVVGSVPLAGMTAYLFGREVLGARPVKLWAAAAYALVPAVTGAVAGGRIGTCVATILLPLLGLAVVRVVRGGSWSAAWTAAILLAVITSFVPIAYVAAVVLGLAACLTVAPRRRLASRLAVTLLAAPLLLLPWLFTIAHSPWLMLGEAGRAVPALATNKLPAYVMLFGSPGGPAAAPFWILGILGPLALAALLRRDRVIGVVGAWLVASMGVVFGLIQSRLSIKAEWLPDEVTAWPGFASVMVIGGGVMALAYAADGVAQVFSRRSFSWRQPIAGVLAVVAVAAPAIAAGWWVIRGADAPLERADVSLPPYISTAMRAPEQPRALVMRTNGGLVRYSVLRANGARLGDVETGTTATTLTPLNSVVSEMLGDSDRQDAAAQLGSYDIGFVYLPRPADLKIAQRLDTTPGLSRSSAPNGAAAWKLEKQPSEIRVLPAGGRDPYDAKALAPGAGRVGSVTTVEVPDGPAGRRLVLAEAFDDGWQATAGGQSLKAVKSGTWAQAFELPEGAASVRIEHAPPYQSRLLILQGVLALIALIFALPTRKREESDGPPAYPEAGKHGAGDDPMLDPAPSRRATTDPRLPAEVRR